MDLEGSIHRGSQGQGGPQQVGQEIVKSRRWPYRNPSIFGEGQWLPYHWHGRRSASKKSPERHLILSTTAMYRCVGEHTVFENPGLSKHILNLSIQWKAPWFHDRVWDQTGPNRLCDKEIISQGDPMTVGYSRDLMFTITVKGRPLQPWGAQRTPIELNSLPVMANK